MKVVSTSHAPAAIGPYSQAIDLGNMVFVSGQTPLHPVDGTIPDGPAAQARQAMENVKAILEAGGSSLTKVVKMTVFLYDMEHFAVVNEVYASYFSGTFPARSCVEVAKLPQNALVEIEAIAVCCG